MILFTYPSSGRELNVYNESLIVILVARPNFVASFTYVMLEVSAAESNVSSQLQTSNTIDKSSEQHYKLRGRRVGFAKIGLPIPTLQRKWTTQSLRVERSSTKPESNRQSTDYL